MPSHAEVKWMYMKCNCPEYVDHQGERPCDNPNEELDCEDCQYGEAEDA